MFTDSTLNDFAPKVEIENLWLEQIDNIDWNEFKDSVYQIGVTKSIEGKYCSELFKIWLHLLIV